MTDKEFELVPSVKDFYLIKLNNPSDCTLHPMIILDKRDDKLLVSIGTEVTLDSNIDSSLLEELLENAALLAEDELNALWQISTNNISYSSIAIIEINYSFSFIISTLDSNYEQLQHNCDIVSKWNLNTYREAF